jgi:hypothetical protein
LKDIEKKGRQCIRDRDVKFQGGEFALLFGNRFLDGHAEMATAGFTASENGVPFLER